MPEVASEVPHLTPRVRALNGQFSRRKSETSSRTRAGLNRQQDDTAYVGIIH